MPAGELAKGRNPQWSTSRRVRREREKTTSTDRKPERTGGP